MLKYIFFIMLITAQLSTQKNSFVHNCIHDKLEKLHPVPMPEILNASQSLNITLDPRRTLVENPQIRITFNSDPLNVNVTDPEMKTLIVDLVQAAIGFFEKRIKIKQPCTDNIVLTNPQQVCIIPFQPPASDYDALGGGIPNSDFHFYITAQDDTEEQYMAYATYCEFSIPLRRPIAARMNFNLKYLKTAVRKTDWKVWIDTTIHEMLHAFAFDKRLYPHYLKASDNTQYGSGVYENITIRGVDTPVFHGELVTAFAKEFFDCPDYNYIQMENFNSAGSFGSHFERALFYDELMTASRMGSSKSLSMITFLMLKDTGWYEVDDRYADKIAFGYKSGCQTVNLACQTPPQGVTYNGGAPRAENLEYDYCTLSDQVKCNPDYTAKGICLEKFPFADDCNIIQDYQNLECIDEADAIVDNDYYNSNQVYNLESRCFESSITGGLPVKCYSNQCNDDGTLTVIMGTINIICTKSGEVKSVPGGEGTLTCPDLNRFCGNRKRLCPGWCSQKGHCTGGVCTCIAGNAGYDCSVSTCLTNEFYDDVAKVCKDTCPNNTFKNTLNQTCHKCHSTCKTCSDKEIDQCIQCPDGIYYQFGKCVATCSDGYFLSSGICDQCNSNCQTCETTDVICLTCPAGKFLNGSVCIDSCPAGKKIFLIKSQCVDTCPSISFLDGNNCVTCSEGTYMENGVCVSTCTIEGTYPKRGDQICAVCDNNCKTCSGGSAQECLSCNLGKNLQMKQCVINCDIGSYAEYQKCLACPIKCIECSSETVCQKCSDAYFYFQNSCLQECPEGTFINRKQRICENCSSECKTCKNKNGCNQCKASLYSLQELTGNLCLESCPNQYYGNADKVCLKCYGSCLTCSGGTDEDCDSCQPGLYILGKQCLLECPAEGYYGDEATKQCFKCDDSCSQCTAAGPQSCIACTNSKYLISSSKTCVSTCPTGTIQNEFLKICWGEISQAIGMIILYILIN